MAGTSTTAPKAEELVPTISFRALQRARTTLEDFALTYLPYLGLKLQDFLLYMDVLIYVEASIYQADEENELLAKARHSRQDHTHAGEQVMENVLRGTGLLSEAVQVQLTQGKEYWALERQLCTAMQDAGAEGALSVPFTEHEVLRASEQKSFDYRVLHLLLCQLSNRPLDPLLWQFLQLDERLVDIGDDLVDYEEDVLANSFNLLRAFVFLHGRKAELKLIGLIGGLERQHQQLLQQLPPELQAHHQTRHLAAASVQGSGRWVFPRLILDEHQYRQSHQEASC